MNNTISSDDNKGVCLLVHNVSHSDFFLATCTKDESEVLSYIAESDSHLNQSISENNVALTENMNTNDFATVKLIQETTPSINSVAFARPKFSAFHTTSTAVLDHLRELRDSGEVPNVIMHPTTEGVDYPIGLSLSPGLLFPSWGDFNVRIPFDQTISTSSKHNEYEIIISKMKETTQPNAIGAIFPLASIILPKWRHLLHSQQRSGKKVLVLLSGSGIPRNPLHNESGNSTINTAKLIEAFVNALYPDIEVRHLPSPDSIFRFDQNVHFMRSVLQPIINQERRQLASKYGASWNDMFHLTVALADGAPARVAAMNAALRSYKPNYLHLYEMKNLWFNFVVSLNDIDYFPFETAKVSPPLQASAFKGLFRQIVDEMKKHYENFTKIRDGPAGDAGHDLVSFWLRKSKKPVLAVVAVQKDNEQQPRFYRGMNMEVSMPTGSLCAERNAIGSALVDDPALHRRHIKIVAVLSATLLPERAWAHVRKSLTSSTNLNGPNHTPFTVPDDKSPTFRHVYNRKSNKEIRTDANTMTSSRENASRENTSKENTSNTMPFEKNNPTVTNQGIESMEELPELVQSNSTPILSTRQSIMTPAAQAADRAIVAALARSSSDLTKHMSMDQTTQAPVHTSHSEDHSSVASTQTMTKDAKNTSTATKGMTACHTTNNGASPSKRTVSKSFDASANSANISNSVSPRRVMKRTRYGSEADATLSPLRRKRSNSVMTAAQQALLETHSVQTLSASPRPISSPKISSRQYLPHTTNLTTKDTADISTNKDTTHGSTTMLGSTTTMHSSTTTKHDTQQISLKDPKEKDVSNLESSFPHVSERQVRDEKLGQGQDGSDIVLNPLAPCGSCMEWLKKVAEVNPDLIVMTFTDTSCEHVYIKSVTA